MTLCAQKQLSFYACVLLALVCLLVAAQYGYGAEESYIISESELQRLQNHINALQAELRLSDTSTANLNELVDHYDTRIVSLEKQLQAYKRIERSLNESSKRLRSRINDAENDLTQLRESFSAYRDVARAQIRHARIKWASIGFGAGVTATTITVLIIGAIQ